jgi:glycine hydroxymethyltransferase
MHVIAAKAVAFGEAARPEFREYQLSVVENAQTLAQGLVDGGLRVVSGGTDNHMVLVDLTPMGLTGQEAETALSKVNITVNKNAIPFDTRPPRVTSGLRLGTPSVSSRGFGTQEMKDIARLIIRTLSNIEDETVVKEVREAADAMTSRFTVPGLDV